MGDSVKVRNAFKAASDFLDPVLNREEIQKSQGQSLLLILGRDLEAPQAGIDALRSAVIGKALDLLSQIHSAFATPADEHDDSSQHATDGEDAALEDARRRRLLNAMLDLISLEGIYPSLSSGVGIPLQQRVISVLPAGVIAKQTHIPESIIPHSQGLLSNIMSDILNILLDSRPSIQPVIRGRILSDIVSGTADLGFNPNIAPNADKVRFQDAFVQIIKETPSAILLPLLSSFLQAETVPWFKSTISSQISRVPLRRGGVLQSIMFIASQFAPSLGQEAQNPPSNGPHFTVQAIMQISTLLSSVPQGVEPSVYFETIAPQLLALLDGDDLDLRKTASFVIGNGILGKRAYGTPGTIGHTIFVEPSFAALTGDLTHASRQWMRQYSDIEGSVPIENTEIPGTNTVVDGAIVQLAVDRLRSLTLQHPNPGLVKRIVYPVLLPLWGLACCSHEFQMMPYREKVMALLQTYFGISVGAQPLKKLVDNLLWDGGSAWTYGTEEPGRIRLIRRQEPANERSNFVRLIDSLHSRTELFTSLLGSDPNSEERTGDLFLYVSEIWLVQHQTSGAGNLPGTQMLGDSEDIVRTLISAKVAEKLLEQFKDTLSRRPLRVLELIKHVIEGELRRLETHAAMRRNQKSGTVSLSSLSNIVPEDIEEAQKTSEKEASESLSTAFSLLSTVLASPEFSTSQEIVPLLKVIKDHIDQLIPLLPIALSKPATTSSMLLEIQLTSREQDESKPPPAHISDLETHRQALANLNSDLPPIQAEGFSLLSKLIIDSSPVLDIPSTLTLLLSIITDLSETSGNEEFIYLNAIKLIGTLASRHPRTIVKTLVDTYTDRAEQRTLDQRLKIGESLIRTVQDLGEALAGETAKILGESMVAVAGRRGSRPETQKARRKQLEREERQREREARKDKELHMPEGWTISSGPSTQPQLNLDEEDSDVEPPERTAHAANIVAAWAAGSSSDEEPEDLRIRASALSILASAIQTNILGLGASIISSAVDLALATLTLEPAPESAILRRASAVLILDILKALDTARENRRGREIGFGFSLSEDEPSLPHSYDQSRGPSIIGNIPSMLRTLGFVESRETDGIVRGHLRVLIESLEAWLEKSLMWQIRGHEEADEPRLDLGDTIAGLSVDPIAGREGRPRIEEIEE